MNVVATGRRPLDHLEYVFPLCDRDLLNPRGSQDLWWTIRVASLVIVVSAVLVLSCGQTDTDTDADECFTPTTRDVSKDAHLGKSLFRVEQWSVELTGRGDVCCRICWLISVFRTSRVLCTFVKASARGKNTSAFSADPVFTVQQKAAKRYESVLY